MPYGRPANVRSHRRGTTRRRRIVAPWIIVATVTVIVLAGMTTGYAYLIRKPCSGQVHATVVASPSMAKTLDQLNRTFAGTDPSADGKCVSIEIAEKDSASMATALGSDWNPKLSGPAPDVWIPESSAWARYASVGPIAERMMPDLQPSLARSPAVMAMPRDMALALGWPKVTQTWADFAKKLDWQSKGKPWQFHLGMADPSKSTASLLALVAMLDTSDDGEIDQSEQQALYSITSVMKYVPDTGELLAGMAKADGAGKDAVFQYMSAFPALEQDVITYNQTNPTEPLVAVYPNDGSADADNPYLVLESAPWVSKAKQHAAGKFLQYLRGPNGRKAFLADGFRDPNRVGSSSVMTEDNGVEPAVPTLPRAVLLPESVKSALSTWTGVTRPTNMLLVMDVSGSMDDPVLGTGKSKLAYAKSAALSAIKTFGDQAHVGLWSFSNGNTPGAKDYKEVVPIRQLSQDLPSGSTQQETLESAINGLKAKDATGLYDTAAAAQLAVHNAYMPGAVNMVVLITDGVNEDPSGGLSMDQLLLKLKQTNADPKKAVPVVTVAYGDKADTKALQQIAVASNGAFLSATNAFDIPEVLMSAVFGRF